jgi:hypothetical protein
VAENLDGLALSFSENLAELALRIGGFDLRHQTSR